MSSETNHTESRQTSSDHEKAWIDRLFPASSQMRVRGMYLLFVTLTLLILHIILIINSGTTNIAPYTATIYWASQSDGAWRAWPYLEWPDARIHEIDNESVIKASVIELRMPFNPYMIYFYYSAHQARIMYTTYDSAYKFNEQMLKDLFPAVAKAHSANRRTRYYLSLNQLHYDIWIAPDRTYAAADSEYVNYNILWIGLFMNITIPASLIVLLWSSICIWRSRIYPSPSKIRNRKISLMKEQCPKCRYNIHHLPTRRCPECGETWNEQEAQLIREQTEPRPSERG